MSRPLGVVLVDDHALLLEAMRRQFDSDPAFKVVGIAESAAGLYELLARVRVDLILLDIQLGEQSGLDLIADLRLRFNDIRIVVISMFEQEIYRERAFALGAEAYVTKGAHFADLRALLLKGSVSASAAGQIWVRSRMAKNVHLTLSSRELAVVGRLAQGAQVKEVADALGISLSSVGTYLRRAMDKLGVQTRAELFQLAKALGGHTTD